MRRALLFALLLPLLVACGNEPVAQTPVYIVVTATPLPAPSSGPALVPNVISAGLPSPTGDVERAPATAQAARAPQDAATVTVVAARTPGIGATLQLAGWVISLARVAAQPAAAGGYDLLIWVDARNLRAGTGALADQVQWRLRNRDGVALGPEPDGLAGALVRAAGRSSLAARVKATALTHPLLVFRTPLDSAPRALELGPAGGDFTAGFSLTAWVPPTPVPTATPRPTPIPPPPPTPAPLLDIHGHASADSNTFYVDPGTYRFAWVAEDDEGYGCYFSATLRRSSPQDLFGQTLVDKIVGEATRWTGHVDWSPTEPTAGSVRVVTTCNWVIQMRPW